MSHILYESIIYDLWYKFYLGHLPACASVDICSTNRDSDKLGDFISLLHSLRHESRCVILDVLSEKPQASSVILRKAKDKARKSRSGVGNLSFSNLPFHLHVLEKNNLVKKHAANKDIGPKGYPIYTSYCLTNLGVYAKAHLSLFKEHIDALKLLFGRSKKGLEFEIRILLSLLKEYYSEEKETVRELKALEKKANLNYYLKKLEIKNCWLRIDKTRTESFYVSKVRRELKTMLLLLNHFQKDRSNGSE